MGLDIDLIFEVDTGNGIEEFCVFEDNYTHNCAKMAKEANIYMEVWQPEEIGLKVARDLIEPLSRGIALMREDPSRFIKLDPPNGWGSYDTFLPWLENYLAACKKYPAAKIKASS